MLGLRSGQGCRIESASGRIPTDMGNDKVGLGFG